jgi:hypothetical protein
MSGAKTNDSHKINIKNYRNDVCGIHRIGQGQAAAPTSILSENGKKEASILKDLFDSFRKSRGYRLSAARGGFRVANGYYLW